jgi:CheY-like chemotaxis protein/HPt (histidine-containing phosphotransfer) domain-containing protein
VADDVPDVLRGDRTRLRQVIVNLVGNAVKFTEQGEVVLSVKSQPLPDDDVELTISIRDTGIGIEASKLEKIFEAFQQADTSTTREFGGTGLGLAICGRLTELMGGRIWVDSQVGQGSTFHFTVRMQVERAVSESSHIDPAIIQGTPVLIVDDNATNRQILAEVLASWGIKAEAASSGQEALETMLARHRDHQPLPLVVTDVNMPNMDGFALSAAVRDHEDLRDATIILLTSRGAGDADRYAELGIAAHLLKPVKQSELFDALAAASGAYVPPPQSTPTVSTQSRLPPLRVLLVEDGVANQKLAIGVLQKWGHAVTLAEDGKRALEQWRGGEFDLILMDIQMPVMDGLEATRRIRAEEASNGRRIPIVAMTAHAMAGDEQKCLDAGMDGYVAKPIRKAALLAAIEPLFPPRVDAESESHETPVTEAHPMGLDMSAALAAVENDADLLRIVLEAMLEETPDLVRQLHAAVGAGDAVTVQRAAHTIKGTMRLFPDQPVREMARQMEAMGREKNLEGATELLVSLDSAADEFHTQLQAALNDK